MRTFLIAAALMVVSCKSDLVSGPEPGQTIRRPATLAFFQNGPELQLPSAVFVNQPILVRFTTYGGGCVQATENETTVGVLVADIRSFQREYIPRPSEACTTELGVESNSVKVTFAEPGEVQIRVFGQKLPGGEPLTIARSITILP